MSFDRTNLGLRIKQFKKSPQFDGFTKVNLVVSDEIEYNSGSETGRVLSVSCPWGTQQICDNILKSLKGFRYQPYKADGAIMDPAVEIGDGVTIDQLYSGVYTQEINFTSLFTSNIEAPEDEEVDHEFNFVPKEQRIINRKFKDVSSKLTVQADLISAEVEQRKSDVETINSALKVQSDSISAKVEKSGGTSSSFGWELDDSSWKLYSNDSEVLTVDNSGLSVRGKIVADSGEIGGFTIESDYLSYNSATWGGYNTYGIYIGPQGIQLGSWDSGFRVDNRGNLYAESGHFRGFIDAGNIDFGGSAGYFDGAGLSSHSVSGSEVDYGTLTTDNTDWNINDSLANGDYSASCLNGYQNAPYLQCLNFKVWSDFYYGVNHIRLLDKRINGQKIIYLGVP